MDRGCAMSDDYATVIDRQAAVIARQHEQIVQLTDALNQMNTVARALGDRLERLMALPPESVGAMRQTFWKDQADAMAERVRVLEMEKLQ